MNQRLGGRSAPGGSLLAAGARGVGRVRARPLPGAETVILLQPATASPAVARSLARIRDELSADRFHVILADSSTAGDPGAVIESAARAAEGGTVLVLFGDPESGPGRAVRRPANRAGVPPSAGPPSSWTIRSGCRRRSRRGRWSCCGRPRWSSRSRSNARRARKSRRSLAPKLTSAPAQPARAGGRTPRSSSWIWASECGTASRDRRLRWRPSVASACACRSGPGRASASPDWEVVLASTRLRIGRALADHGSGRRCRGLQTRQTYPPDIEPRRRRSPRGRRRDGSGALRRPGAAAVVGGVRRGRWRRVRRRLTRRAGDGASRPAWRRLIPSCASSTRVPPRSAIHPLILTLALRVAP